MLTTRRATEDDLADITDIYNQAVLTTTGTFDTEPKDVTEQRVWFADHGGKFPVFVAELDGRIVAWASLSRWSGRCAYADTGEISIYVHEDCRGKGIGKALLADILAEGQRGGLHTVLARIASGNDASIRLHEAAGFQHVGAMREVGRKFGKLLDVQLMQIMYADSEAERPKE